MPRPYKAGTAYKFIGEPATEFKRSPMAGPKKPKAPGEPEAFFFFP